jgi:hypothetical protein
LIFSDVDFVADHLVMGTDLAEKRDLLASKGPAYPFCAASSAIKAQKLPDCIDAQTAGLDGISDKVALEKPKISSDILFCDNKTVSGFSGELQDAVNHQEWGSWKAEKIDRRIFDCSPMGQP